MRPSRKVMPAALLAAVLLAGPGVPAARAAYFPAEVRALDLQSDVSRSPRLLGMGSLSLVVPDRNQEINLWDFAHSPIGVALEDTVPTLELWPGSSSTSALHEGPFGTRQDLGGRATNTGFEIFHRDGEHNAFGALGSLSSLRHDTPYSDDLERRRSVGVPSVEPILAGPFPYWGGGKLLYAIRMRFGSEHLLDEYRRVSTNAAGQFISLDGEAVNPPQYFEPVDDQVSTMGAGLAFAYPVGKHAMLAVGADGVQEKYFGTNARGRYASEQREKRPYGIGQVSLVGHLGNDFDYGTDVRAWTSNSERSWVFSLSAGVGADPLSGRGKLLTRYEKGVSSTTRVRWRVAGLELGAGVQTAASNLNIRPPDLTDLTSLNYFLNSSYYRTNADTLIRPDSVISVDSRERAYSFGVGASRKFGRGLGGVEFHMNRDRLVQSVSGLGPDRKGWDVRGGYEFPCNKVLTGRLGLTYRWFDRDALTKLNEFTGRGGSLGLGLHPAGTSWSLELGWALEWLQSDFDDPLQQRSSRQQLASQLSWRF